ncbi:MAG TPA: AsmA-like C-terminal region-containing protein [Bacteroidales bacterium]|nr:AsmA-like C-terminal region-containing protein [Bacteroidales bacterium]HQG36331.1 AsmA-like C-terminal region-containing protein [Bacteroidales bacterium]HQG52485.1 AsmA-like C-terminal region-containing protein [Bacteroidales bacterium]HQJ20036.1 AsmA-like C-terminal region-containing protein [Bacteroidales bacterium]
MKKTAKLLLKIISGLILLILILLFTIPVLFKDKIKTGVESIINESINAKVAFADYSLGFFSNFPNLTFSLKDVYVTGIDKFEGDTLAGFSSLRLVFNLPSLFSKSGYEIKSVVLDKAIVNAISLKDGSVNWNIIKPSADTTEIVETPKPQPQAQPQEEAGTSNIKILLRKLEIRNSNIKYTDENLKLAAILNDLNYILTGNMSLSETDLSMSLNIAETTLNFDGVKYLNKAVIDTKINLLANLDSMKFTFKENYFAINDFRLNFAGTVAMPGKDISTDVTFATNQTSFKTLLSLIPAVYMTGYEDLRATGSFALSGSAKGIYSDADSTLPDISLNLNVKDGIVSYPALPEKISAININIDALVNGKNLDLTTVNLNNFHFELAGNPFDMTFFLKTPISDPDFKGTVNGKISLDALSKALPLQDLKLSGLIEMALNIGGRLSMIEKKQYESFTANGTLGIQKMFVSMTGIPQININEAMFRFSPAYTSMEKVDILVAGTSDLFLNGNIENYLPYLFRNETIKGKLTLSSKKIDISSILSSLPADTTAVVEDTTALALIVIPKNIDFDFNAIINNLIYDKIDAKNFKGHVIIRDGILSLRETGMEMLGGSIRMNADYDTRDTLKPTLKADFEIKNVDIQESFNTFVAMQKLAQVAKGLEGRVSIQLKYESLLGSNMMPVIQTINGYGKLQSEEVRVVEAAAFDKLKELLNLGDKYSNTLKDLNISFNIRDGRVYISPFDIKMGNIKMNISGDHGLDQTLNYLVKTEIPSSELGSSVNNLINNLSAQASSFGVVFKPADVIKVNVRIRGTVDKPEVTPDFGSGAEGKTGTIKETAKETVKQTIDNAVDKGKEKLSQEAEEMGNKLIKEAEEKGRQLRDEADKAAIKLKEEAEAKAADMIKAAETKGAVARAAAQKAADALIKEAEKEGDRLRQEADKQAIKLLEEAKAKKEEMINKK